MFIELLHGSRGGKWLRFSCHSGPEQTALSDLEELLPNDNASEWLDEYTFKLELYADRVGDELVDSPPAVNPSPDLGG